MINNRMDYNYDCLITYIKEHQEDFYRLAYSYVRERETALDLVQEAIIKAITKIDTLKQIEYLKTWFYRILINECLNYLRRNKIVYTPIEELHDCGKEDHDIASNLDLYDAISQLAPKIRTIITLRYFEDMKLSDIARILKCSENTVKTRLYRGLKELKNILGEESLDGFVE